MSDREEFEKAWRAKWKNDSPDIFTLRENGEYVWEPVQDTWEGFQLGRASVAEKCPVDSIDLANACLAGEGWSEEAKEIKSFLAHITSIKEGK